MNTLRSKIQQYLINKMSIKYNSTVATYKNIIQQPCMQSWRTE